MAAILDRHFGDPDATPRELADAFHDVAVPIHQNDHIAAAALRADRRRVRHTGRWLVRHSTDRGAALVGLALLATDWAEEDIPLIQTIGLLSNTFGPLAAKALRRRTGGGQALLWLAQRVTGWGRVYIIEELCEYGHGAGRAWLLRHACDGDYLNGYFAGKVATATHLHEAITNTGGIDDDLIDHTGRLLHTMAHCNGMGMTLEHYPPAPIVLAAHVAHLSRQTPTANRYVNAALIVDRLTTKAPEQCGCTTEQRDEIVRQYLAVLNRQDWCAAIQANDRDDDFASWFAGNVANRLHLRAFPNPPGDDR
ncbi:hypothetical protein [Alloactinosynnema sp. L-07]|nr:hypothetical protein [Alloactinosynnema sp. L-07]